MSAIPHLEEQRLVARATLVAAKNTSESTEKFVHWMLAGFSAGLIYVLGQKNFEIKGVDLIAKWFVVAAILGVLQRLISMMVTNAGKVSEEVEKLVEPGIKIDPERFLLVYIDSLPASVRFSAAWAASNLLKGNLTSFPRYLLVASMFQSLLSLAVAGIIARCVYLVVTGATLAPVLHP